MATFNSKLSNLAGQKMQGAVGAIPEKLVGTLVAPQPTPTASNQTAPTPQTPAPSRFMTPEQINQQAASKVTIPTVMQAEEMGNVPTPNIPPQEETVSAQGFIDSLQPAQTSFQDFIGEANKQLEPTQTERTALRQQLEGAQDNLLGRSAAQQAAEERVGLPAQVKQLQDLNVQIAQRQGEFSQQFANEAGTGRGRTTAFVGGRQAAIRNQAAAEIGALSSVAAAVQGNIALSQQIADRAVEFQFADAEQEVRNLMLQLELNKEDMTTAEKRRAEQLQFELQERQNSIDSAKENRKQVLNLAAEAAQQGADNATLTKMSQAQTPEQALSIGGTFLGNKFRQDQEQQQFNNALSVEKLELDRQSTAMDNAYKRAQIANIQSQIDERIATDQPLDLSQLDIPGLSAEQKNKAVITSLLQSNKIGQGTRTQMSNVLGVINALEDVAKNNTDGNLAGVNPIRRLLDVKIPFTDINIIPFRNNFKKDGSIETEAYANAINLKVQQWASGASLTNEQTEQVRQLTPTVKDTDAQFKTKMNTLANFMLTQAATQLQSEGISYQPEKVNFFEVNDLIKKASPEQVKELEQSGLIQ